MRLGRFVAQGGVCSRRHADELIAAGRVRVNGAAVKLGSTVDPERDEVEVDGRKVIARRPAYWVLHKPVGVVTTARDPQGRPTVFDLLPRSRERLFSVGRLDFNTEGVLLLTNDGDLAFALSHPSRGVTKTYQAKLGGRIAPADLERLRRGVTLDDGTRTRPAEVRVVRETGKNTWLELTLHEGKNRQVHRMAEAIGRRLVKLRRTDFGGIGVGDLQPGEWRPLTADELARLRRAPGRRR